MEKAIWDTYHTRIFCDLCKEETTGGNRPGPCLNRKGYKNLEEKFFHATSKKLTKKQFRNKWDFCQNEYTKFMDLKRAATGLGWNDQLSTIVADDNWWKLHLVDHLTHAKFRKKGLENIEALDIMYADAHLNRHTATIPWEISIEEIEDEGEDTDDEMLVASLKKGKKSLKRNKSSLEDKEEKNSFFREFNNTMGKINSRVEGSSTSVPTSFVPNMKEVLKMMVESGAVEGTDLFFTATKLVMQPECRELFLLIETKEGRLDWLQRHHAEQMNK